MVTGSLAAATLVAVLAVYVWVGLRARTRGAGGDVEDYVVARNSQSARMLGLSFLASGMGAWVLFAPPEVGATVGAAAIVGYALGAAAPLAAFALLGRRMRAVVPAGHALTEWVRLRFGRAFHGWIVGVSISYMLIFVTAELTAIGGAAALLSDLPPRLVIAAVAAATLAYTAYGGLRATLWTDRLQGWSILALLTAAVVAILTQQPDAVGPRVAGLRLVSGGGLQVALTLIIAVTVANLFHQGYWQRVWAARDARALNRGAALGAITTMPVVAVCGLLGLVAAESGVILGDPPVPFFALLAGVPTWLTAVVFVLALSLVASSVDTLENGLAALVAAERPPTGLRGARWATVALMVPAVAVAVQGHSVLRLFLVADVLCAGAVVPALLSLWRRATAAGALAGAVAGLAGAVAPGWLATGSLAQGVLLATFPGAVPTLPPFLGALLASALVAVGVSLAAGRATDLEALAARVPILGRRAAR
ncbi:MAG TPA: hypothetical protein VG452_03330 [Egibacteraceae bacterium]|nr:hypothetical protein [Egibacteraceae bacterium]